MPQVFYKGRMSLLCAVPVIEAPYINHHLCTTLYGLRHILFTALKCFGV